MFLNVPSLHLPLKTAVVKAVESNLDLHFRKEACLHINSVLKSLYGEH